MPQKQQRTYGEAGKLVFHPGRGAPGDEEYEEPHYTITDRPGHRDDCVIHNQEVVSVYLQGRWQDLLADFDGEIWQFKNAQGTVVPLDGRGQLRVRMRLS